MTDPLLPAGDGHTALGPDEMDGLLPTYIATRGELNEAEQDNISKALRRQAPTWNQLLDDKYLRGFHKAMFGEVWSWAGAYRRRETNLGIEPAGIAAAVRALVDDTRTWIEHGTFDRDDTCIRFHHRLVAIHPFPNGNGRHGRYCADYLVEALGDARFTWGAGQLVSGHELRRAYISSLRAADGGVFGELQSFARS